MKKVVFITLLTLLVFPLKAEKFLLEAEAFSDLGGWSVDQQFIDQMGSAYLIAHGLGVPVSDASTCISVSDPGTYHFYVRTYNWTSPWTSAEGPGAFRVKVNGKALKGVLGVTGSGWEWQYAGASEMKAGENKIAVGDMKGFDGRCDAIWITKGKDDVPPSSVEQLESFRREHGTIFTSAQPAGQYDFVVVGGGIGGMCAAVTAARLGAKVALVHDRAVLGGNNSSEIRVHLGGRIELEPYPALGRMIREFGHSRGGNAQPAEFYEDEKKDAFVRNEPNVTYFPLSRAVRVKMSDGHTIASVIARNVISGEEFELSAPVFCDCTGDGCLGFMAGADYRMGRESFEEFHETLAPAQADDRTLGASVQWYSKDFGKKTSFPEFNYGISFTDESCEKVKMGEWTWETGMDKDMITEFEQIRDYGMLVIYSNWSFLKNHSAVREEYSHRNLDWVAFTSGKRESRRLLGDYILSQQDIDLNVWHEDASFTTAWHMDLHFPDGRNSSYFPGMEFKAETKDNLIYPYPVPYRCLYSRNINNLFMAGRDISVTHTALGTTRLMRTIGMMGEVVGMAESLCLRYGVMPRDVYRLYLDDLRKLMTKGAARPGDIPDNQRFNEGGHLKEPMVTLPAR